MPEEWRSEGGGGWNGGNKQEPRNGCCKECHFTLIKNFRKSSGCCRTEPKLQLYLALKFFFFLMVYL